MDESIEAIIELLCDLLEIADSKAGAIILIIVIVLIIIAALAYHIAI